MPSRELAGHRREPGLEPGDECVGLGALDLLAGKTVRGAFMGNNRFPVDMPRLVDMYMAGKLKLDEMISQRIKLEQVNEGFEEMKKGELARSVIVFDGLVWNTRPGACDEDPPVSGSGPWSRTVTRSQPRAVSSSARLVPTMPAPMITTRGDPMCVAAPW